jgi:hypothetical protein
MYWVLLFSAFKNIHKDEDRAVSSCLVLIIIIIIIIIIFIIIIIIITSEPKILASSQTYLYRALFRLLTCNIRQEDDFQRRHGFHKLVTD